MMAATSTLVLILGARPGLRAEETLGSVPTGTEVRILVPGTSPTTEQQAFVSRAMELSWEGGFFLTAELVVDPSTIAGSLDGQPVRILADRRERRRLGLAPEPID
jgi:hypothetical protein